MNLRTPLFFFLVCCLGTLALEEVSFAQERQFRKLELIDGRTVRAEVLATESTGLRMLTPQGETLVSFELLMDMVPIDQAEYEDQGSERVWLSLPEHDPGLRAIFGAIPNLIISESGASKLAAVAQTEALEACGDDIGCARDAVASGDWLWLVFVAPPPDDTAADLVFRGGPSGAKRVSAIESEKGPYAQWQAAHQILGLVAPPKLPQDVLDAFPDSKDTKPPKTTTPAKAWTADRVNKNSLVPLPGYTSFAQGDAGLGAAGLIVGLAGTGAIAGVSILQVNQNKDARPGDYVGAAALIVGAHLAISGLVNNALGHTSLKKGDGVAVLPSPGGATLTMNRTF